MTQRWALGLQYLGTHYHGWQWQTGLPTVQAAVEQALSQIAATPIRITTAGRTDAGVHALAQVVHFDAPVLREARSWVWGGNRHLAPDIRLQWAKPVAHDFDARFSAVARTYRYTLYQAESAHALYGKTQLWCPYALDIDAMRAATEYWLGEHDFSAFRGRDCQAKSPIRTLHALDITQVGSETHITLTANAFLHHMVRIMVGVLLEIGRARQPIAWAGAVLASKQRQTAGKMAPARGLCLMSIAYSPGVL